MEPKKNPKADVGRNSALYFVIGLAAVLALVYGAMEWKKYDKVNNYDISMNVEDQLDEEVPMTEQIKTPPPPPPPAAPEVIEVVEDEEEVEETIIESTETSQEEIVEVEEVEVAEEEEEIGDVPFAVIEDVPIFPGCESKRNNQERKDCMSEKINEFVNRRFDTGLGSDLGLSGINRIYVQFRIEKNGNITVLGARAPHPRLQQEAERVVNMLPKMQPGKQRGQPVGVLYSLPITFRVQD